MGIPVTPTLSSASGYLSDVRDQIANLVRFIIMNPGGTSDLWEGSLISFRLMSAAYESDPDSLCNHLQEAVSGLLVSKFTDYKFDVSFTTKDYDVKEPGVRYTIIFSILITEDDKGNTNTQPALVSGDILVDKTTNEIKLKYNKSVDTAELSGG